MEDDYLHYSALHMKLQFHEISAYLSRTNSLLFRYPTVTSGHETVTIPMPARQFRASSPEGGKHAQYILDWISYS